MGFVHLLGAAFSGITEGSGGALGDQGGLEQHQFLEPEALAQSGHVVHDCGGEFFGLQPDARKRVTLGEDQQRVQSCLLKCGAEQQS